MSEHIFKGKLSDISLSSDCLKHRPRKEAKFPARHEWKVKSAVFIGEDENGNKIDLVLRPESSPLSETMPDTSIVLSDSNGYIHQDYAELYKCAPSSCPIEYNVELCVEESELMSEQDEPITVFKLVSQHADITGRSVRESEK